MVILWAAATPASRRSLFVHQHAMTVWLAPSEAVCSCVLRAESKLSPSYERVRIEAIQINTEPTRAKSTDALDWNPDTGDDMHCHGKEI